MPSNANAAAEEPEFLTTTEAAAHLGVSTETIRQRLQSGELQGDREPNGRWLVRKTTVDARLAKVGKKNRSDWNDRPEEIDDLQELRDRVGRLEDRLQAAEQELQRVIGERDRYRAEASTLRATAIHFQASAHEASVALRAALAGLENAQSQSLSAMLGPRSPGDIGVG